MKYMNLSGLKPQLFICSEFYKSVILPGLKEHSPVVRGIKWDHL